MTRNSNYVCFFLIVTPFYIFSTKTNGQKIKDIHAEEKSIPENVQKVLSSTTAEEQEYAERKRRFILEAIAELIDTSTSANITFDFSTKKPLPFLHDYEGLAGLNPEGSFPGSKIRYPYIQPMVPLSNAIQSLAENYRQSRKKVKPGNWPIPTDMEIDVLKVLWIEGEATSGEIYSKLDTSTIIFAAELQSVLKKMVDHGFLDRKKISPSNTFSLFGFAQIELSSKNRKNKLYLYWPVVTLEQLHTYLDSKRFLALMKTRGKGEQDLKNKNYGRNYQKYLEKKLYRIFE